MKIVKVILLVCALSFLGTVLVPNGRADGHDNKTIINISTPFEIPGGQILPAGTYTFVLFDTESSRHVVQIWNADSTHLIANVLAINNYRFKATGKTVMLFSERPGDRPNAIKVWFYPGNNYGQEFVYPKHRAVELAVAEKEPVPALTLDTVPVEAELQTTPIIAVTPEQKEVPVADVIQLAPLVEEKSPTLVAENTTPEPLAPQELPKTASLIPLMALLGVVSLGIAFVLKQIAG